MTEYEDISVEKTIISMFHHMAFFSIDNKKSIQRLIFHH